MSQRKVQALAGQNVSEKMESEAVESWQLEDEQQVESLEESLAASSDNLSQCGQVCHSGNMSLASSAAGPEKEHGRWVEDETPMAQR